MELITNLFGGWTTHLKNMLVKWDIFPKVRGENSKNVSNHHLVIGNHFKLFEVMLINPFIAKPAKNPPKKHDEN